jgi:hypothetical protein
MKRLIALGLMVLCLNFILWATDQPVNLSGTCIQDAKNSDPFPRMVGGGGFGDGMGGPGMGGPGAGRPGGQAPQVASSNFYQWNNDGIIWQEQMGTFCYFAFTQDFRIGFLHLHS